MIHKGFEYNLHEKVDHIKGNWFLWSVTRIELDTDIETEGSMQADGQRELIAWDSFEED